LLFFLAPGVDGRIILKWIFEGLDGGWTGSIWLRKEVADSCECGNNPYGSIKRGEFFE
jgi:hypothetical protein